MTNHLQTIGFFVVIYLVVPIALAKLAVGANWQQIGIAYAILYGGGWLILGAKFNSETIGWVMIMGMFWTIPAIPILSLILRLIGFAR